MRALACLVIATAMGCGTSTAPTQGAPPPAVSQRGSQFALVEGEKTYLLDGDVALVKKFAGQRARIVGAANGHTITVSFAAAS